MPEFLGGAIYFDFKRATVFGLGHLLSRHKTTRNARHVGGHDPFSSLAMPMEVDKLSLVLPTDKLDLCVLYVAVFGVLL